LQGTSSRRFPVHSLPPENFLMELPPNPPGCGFFFAVAVVEIPRQTRKSFFLCSNFHGSFFFKPRLSRRNKSRHLLLRHFRGGVETNRHPAGSSPRCSKNFPFPVALFFSAEVPPFSFFFFQGAAGYRFSAQITVPPPPLFPITSPTTPYPPWLFSIPSMLL